MCVYVLARVCVPACVFVCASVCVGVSEFVSLRKNHTQSSLSSSLAPSFVQWYSERKVQLVHQAWMHKAGDAYVLHLKKTQLASATLWLTCAKEYAPRILTLMVSQHSLPAG